MQNENGAKTPNIKFTGKDKIDRKSGKVVKSAVPVESFISAGRKITLPGAAEQLSKRKFYSADAGVVRSEFPHKYKLIVPKGAK